jgi:hypothetical protein
MKSVPPVYNYVRKETIMKNPKKRAKEVEQAMRLAWASLESHLRYTHEKCPEGNTFHKKCVKEYVQILKNLSELY